MLMLQVKNIYKISITLFNKSLVQMTEVLQVVISWRVTFPSNFELLASHIIELSIRLCEFRH
jgi:hypothetical protein